jgi:hypothetical protein
VVSVNKEKGKSGFVVSSSYIETLILTLTNVELSVPGSSEYVASRLELELEALSLYMPSVRKLYTEFIRKYFSERFKDVAPPNIEAFGAIDALTDYILDKFVVLFPKLRNMHPSDKKNYARSVAVRIVKASALATLYAVGLIRI